MSKIKMFLTSLALLALAGCAQLEAIPGVTSLEGALGIATPTPTPTATATPVK